MRLFPATEDTQRLDDPDVLIAPLKGFPEHKVGPLQEHLVLFRRIGLGGDGANGSMENRTCFQDIMRSVQGRIEDGDIGVELFVKARVARGVSGRRDDSRT